MRRTLALFILFFHIQLLGQTLSVGLIGGAAVTDAVQSQAVFQEQTWSPEKDWLAGLMFDLRLRGRFSLEVDAIYRELHAKWAFVEPNGTLNSVSPANVVTWEVPMLAKYRFGGEGRFKPFVEAGPALRTTGNLNFMPSHHGVAAGLGIETYWRGFRIAPVVRYTYWAKDRFPGAGPTSQQGQVEMMVAVNRVSQPHGGPFGSRVSLGALGGWGLTKDAPSSTQSYTVIYVTGSSSVTSTQTQTVDGLRSPVVGPALEVSLTPHFSVEADGLYRLLRDRGTLNQQGAPPPFPETVNFSGEMRTWEFPILAKYGLRLGTVRPFVEAGPAFRPVSGDTLSPFGVTAGGGVEMHWRAIRVAPTLRFNHWAADRYGTAGWSRNEVEFLMAFMFGGPCPQVR